MPLTTVSTGGILDGTIINADISASAGIVSSKLTGLTSGRVETNPTVSASETLAANRNIAMIGPISLNSGVTITIPSDSRLVILG